MQPGWCQPVRQEFMENEYEALPGVAYPGVRDNRSTINTKTGYDEYDDDDENSTILGSLVLMHYQRVTDRQTDTLSTAKPHSSIAEHDKNLECFVRHFTFVLSMKHGDLRELNYLSANGLDSAIC